MLTIPNNELKTLNILIAVVVGFFVFFTTLFVSTLCCIGVILFIGVLTKGTGIQLDPAKKTYRKYTKLFWQTTGTWKNIGAGTCLVVLTKQGSRTSVVTRGMGSYRHLEKYNELYLMNKSHTSRVFLDASEEKENIELLAKEISEAMNIPIEQFNPRVSEYS